jgi:hypothetical protein
MNFLKANLAGYFNDIPNEVGISQFFVQNCLYPRLMFSPSDALFSIKFLKLLVDLKVPRINVLNVFA